VQASAEAARIEVRTPGSLRDPETQREFAALDADLAVVAAYGLILPEAILRAPRHGCINVHASLLPRWRGAAPIQRAILAGDELTGVTIMAMAKGLDTGPTYMAESTRIDVKTAGELTQELAAMGGALSVKVIEGLPALRPTPQHEEGVTYAAKLDKAEARLDFGLAAAELERHIRAFNPFPGAFFEWNGERFKILAAETTDASGEAGTVLDERLAIACGTGTLVPTLVQRAGRATMPVEELVRGLSIPPGTRLA
jgi:methionyl-tRNA formyltransferase